MNITEEKTGDLTSILKLEVNEADYINQFERELKNQRRQATQPGFRPGNVPMGIIRKKFGMPILLDEVNKLVSEKLNGYIKDNNLDLLGYPLANGEKDPQDFNSQKDFTFYFDIGYAPQIDMKLSEYEAVDYLKILADDDKVAQQVDEIRKKSGKLEEQSEVGAEDMVHVKIDELDEAGKVLEGGISNSTMILVSSLKQAEAQEQMMGAKVGDVVIFNPLTATGSDTETASMLGIDEVIAKDITHDFQFEVTKIERNVAAEMGEELYKAAFPKDEIKTEEEFKERVREEISKVFESESDRLFSRQAMDKLFDNTEVSLPNEFLKKWLYASNEGKVSMEEIEANYEGYQKSMKMELIESKLIGLNEGLKVSDEDIKNEIKNYFKGYFGANQNPEGEEDPMMAQQLDQIADNYLEKNKEEVKRINDDLFNKRLSAFLKAEMVLNEQETSYDDFVKEINKYSAPTDDHDHDHDHDHNHGEAVAEDNA